MKLVKILKKCLKFMFLSPAITNESLDGNVETLELHWVPQNEKLSWFFEVVWLNWMPYMVETYFGP